LGRFLLLGKNVVYQHFIKKIQEIVSFFVFLIIGTQLILYIRIKDNMEKTCRMCGKIKFINEFHLKKGTLDGHRNECKECVKDVQKKYKEAPGFKEKQKEYDKARYDENRDSVLERKKEYHKENRDKILTQKEQYRNDPNNTRRIKDYLEDYRKNHREEAKAYVKNNSIDNSINQTKYRERYPHIIAWRSLLYSTLKRLGTPKQNHTIDMLGYSALELKEHIEKQFLPGMNWENHGEWHIDHIHPVTKFSNTEDVRIVCALENLQPLWAFDNLTKK
jgi:hypothetical protein